MSDSKGPHDNKGTRPSYSHLEKQTEKLRREYADIEHIFNMSLDLLCILGYDGYFKRLNPAFELILGFSRQELMANNFLSFVHPDDREKTRAAASYHNSTGVPLNDFENRYRCQDGSYKWISWAAHPDPERGVTYSVGRDVTELKRDREELRRARDKLEERVTERTSDLVKANKKLKKEIEERIKTSTILKRSQRDLEKKSQNLEELNAALRVLLKQRDIDKREFEESVLYIIDKQVRPYLQKLERNDLHQSQSICVDLIFKGLEQVTSSFTRKIIFGFPSLTPAELRVADMIVHGESTKDIALAMTISPRTVETHRKNIRRKLGLSNKGVNLRSHLL